MTKSIYSYLDYRKFLQEFLEERRKENAYFSYRSIGKKLGIDPSNIAKVIQLKRHISNNNIEAFAKFCKLNSREQKYFKTLVAYNKEKSTDEKIKLEEQLLDIKYLSPKKLDYSQYEYYQKWYHSAILALLYYYEFSGNYRELGAMLEPPISAEETKESIKLLENLHLIKKNVEGKYQHTHELLSTGDEWSSIAIRNFQRETLKLALRSFDTHPKNIRDISTATITVAKEDLPKLRQATEEYRNRILQIIEESVTPTHVYQLNVQLFPLTQGAAPCK